MGNNYIEERNEELKEIETEYGVKLEETDTFTGMMTKLFNKLMQDRIPELIDKPLMSWTEEDDEKFEKWMCGTLLLKLRRMGEEELQ